MLKKIAIFVVAVIIVFTLAEVSYTADNDSHQVTVTVAAINELAITGGNITLTIDTAVAGSNPTDDTDSTCSLDWTTNQTARKITVETSVAVPPQLFSLTVDAAVTLGGGIEPGPAITLTHGAGASDFITGVATELGGATLTYSASATAAQGTGSDVHTVTFTLTAS
ncbi:MAG: hypothetical protein ACMUIL_02825 [bacterium]